MKRKAKRRRRWGRWMVVALLGAMLLPVVEVGCARVVNPPGTPLMALRRLEGVDAKIRYRWMDLKDVPEPFLRGVIGLEDARFFDHDGIDWKEVKAARRDAKRKRTRPRGASTITMQCARSTFLWQGRSWIRKGLEVYYTALMETLLPKRRILELYVNVIEMGEGVYGIGAAAEAHFGKPAGRLTRNECALLAAMLPAPRTFDPASPGPKLRARQQKALERGRSVRLE